MRRKAAFAAGAAITFFGTASGALAHPHGA
jgi:hypothetical protein